MQRLTRFGVAVLAAAALAALLAGPAAAKAPKLDLTWNLNENQTVPGETVDTVLGEGGLQINTNPGTVSCAYYGPAGFSGIHGTDVSNNEVKDMIETGEGVGSLSGGEPCTNTTALGATANEDVFANTSILTLSSKGTAQLKAKGPTTPIYFETFYSGGAQCIYTTTKLKGTLTMGYVTEELKNLSITFTSQKLKLNKEFSSVECQKKGVTVSAQFDTLAKSEGPFGFGWRVFGHLV